MKLELMVQRKKELEEKIAAAQFSEKRKIEIFSLPEFTAILPLNVEFLKLKFIEIARSAAVEVEKVRR